MTYIKIHVVTVQYWYLLPLTLYVSNVLSFFLDQLILFFLKCIRRLNSMYFECICLVCCAQIIDFVIMLHETLHN
jgi:hypothetical protein